jgi:hypothetical protein
MTERGIRKTKSDVIYFLGIRLTRARSDYVDREGRPVRHADVTTREDVGGWDDRDEVGRSFDEEAQDDKAP